MAKTSFIIRSNKKLKSDVSIWVRYYNGKRIDFKTPTGLSIPANSWDKKLEVPKSGSVSQEDKERFELIEARLKGIKSAINKAADIYLENFTLTIAKKVIADYIESITIEKEVLDIPTDIVGYLGYKIPKMEAGEMLHGGNRYDPNTIKVWNSFLKVLIGFVKYHKKTIYIPDIDKTVYDSFMNHLSKCDYLPKTRNKYVICFKALIGFAYDDGIAPNKDSQKYFSKLKVNEGDKAAKIYLTEDEIQAFYDMPLEPGSMYDKVRDIFLCGCYTAQRVSDYGRLTGDNFVVTAKGNKVVRITQAKTGNEVIVPYLNDNLKVIADKYNGEIPSVSDVIVNRYIKQIGAKLSEKVPSLAKMEKTILTQKEKANEKTGKTKFNRDKYGNVIRPKYDMICTHTARRSAITTMYLTGLFDTFQLMKISGHKTERTLLDYLCMSGEETADRIAELLRKRKSGKEEMF